VPDVLVASSWSFPLFVHIFGAMILVGGLLTAAAALALARDDATVLRLGYRSLLLVALPGFVLMRIGAEWTASREGWRDVDDQPAWLGIGYITSDVGGLLLAISLILGGVGLRRLRGGGGTGPLKATLALSLLMLAAYVVAIWAMGAKPV
jgi:hypothetical protein